MKKGMLIGAGALLVLAGAGAAWAQMGPHRGGMRMMKHMISSRIEDAEDLVQATPQQRQQIEQSKETILGALEAKAKTRGASHPNIAAILTADKLDTDALYALANQHAQDIQDMAKVIVPEIQKIHDTLTPAQRQKLADHIQQMHQNHHGGGFGGPPEE